MSALCPSLLLRLVACVIVVAAGLASPRAADALDYDRNDVRARELGLNMVVAPIAGNPLGILLHGKARRHRRQLYIGSELQVGALLDGHPWLGVGCMVGGETAADAWARERGYAELGTTLSYMNTKLGDALGFFAEVGVRYQVRAFDRPHLLITVGARGMTNFLHAGVAAQMGLAWTFD